MCTVDGEAIRKKRKKLCLSLQELADDIGISRAALSNYERNEHSNPALLTVRRLERALRVRKGTFFT